jgi:hypothetical protein
MLSVAFFIVMESVVILSVMWLSNCVNERTKSTENFNFGKMHYMKSFNKLERLLQVNAYLHLLASPSNIKLIFVN